MPTILHLTDLHLSTQSDELGDYKSEIIPQEDRVHRMALLENTARELATWLASEKRTLDAVAITGDVTYRGEEEGFKALEQVLAALGTFRPPKEKVIVVPGNHDVAWRTEPGAKARYEGFIKHMRGAGYVTPLLDGIDIDPHGRAIGTIDPARHLLHDPAAGWTIVPLNSSNYCGSVERFKTLEEQQLWDELPNLVPGAKKDAVEKLLSNQRLYDVARFSPAQLLAVRRLLQQHAQEKTVRIALLHHHLLPVNVDEEAKPYESILNLGAVRLFLSHNHFNVVLHGHKHSRHSYIDEIQLPETKDDPQRVYVISGSTLGLGGSAAETARLVEIVTPITAPRVDLRAVSVATAGAKVKVGEPASTRLWGDRIVDRGRDAFKVINAPDTHTAYARLMDLFDVPDHGDDDAVFYVVAHIENPRDAVDLPPSYPADFPKPAAEKSRQKQFEDLVKWWQQPSSRLLNDQVFTHGARISSQLGRLQKTLQNSGKEGRAVVTLLNPEVDKLDEANRKCPAFCLAQLFVTNEGGVRRLNCVGYFRKQETRYWWPVNVAELHKIQKDVLKKLQPAAELGSITTIATVATSSKRPPRVAVPFIDRMLDLDKSDLWRNLYALVRHDPEQAAKTADFWMAVLDDLTPASEMPTDGSPISTAGLEYVCEYLGRFAKAHTELKAVLKPLDLLRRNNASVAVSIATGKDDDYEKWRADSLDTIEEAREAIRSLLNQKPRAARTRRPRRQGPQ